jgi:crotonobetainyl-CoA:carnitine CoA-transferase CaiB-like acyl-CoA transferase
VNADGTPTGPLTGLRVVDLSRVLAGPFCTMMLGDLGAEIIKVERPGSGDDTRGWGPPFADGESAYFLGVNRNKRSITLDLKQPEGREILAGLLATADVLVENFRMGTLERLGFDAEWLAEHAPRLVRVTISGYGSTGPLAGRPGYDFILQAETGLMSITGEPDGAAMKLGVAIVDLCTGMQAAISALSALEARHRTGRGQHAEVSLHDTGLSMLANVAANHLVSGDDPQRFGNGHPNIVPYRTYEARDGEVAIAVGNDAQFRRFAALVGHPEWADDPRFTRNADRVRNRDEIDRLVGEVVAKEDRDHWLRVCDEAGIPCGPIRSVSEALATEHAAAREMLVDVEHPTAGLVRLLGSPFKLSATPTSIRTPPPLLGEHTDAILHDELGYDEQRIAQLRERGVV